MDRPLMVITHDAMVDLLLVRPDGTFYLRRTVGWGAFKPEYIEMTEQQTRQWLSEFGMEDQVERWKQEFNIPFRRLPGIYPGSFFLRFGFCAYPE